MKFHVLVMMMLMVVVFAKYKSGITLAFNNDGMNALGDVSLPFVKKIIDSVIPISVGPFYKEFIGGGLKLNVTKVDVTSIVIGEIEMSIIDNTGIELVLRKVSGGITWYLWYDAIDIIESTTIGESRIDNTDITLNLVLSNLGGRLDIDVQSNINIGSIENTIVDVPLIVEEVLDAVLKGVLNSLLSSSLDPIINIQVEEELNTLWKGYIYLDPQNKTVLNYNLTGPIYLGEGFLNLYLSGDVHSTEEETCILEYIPDPDLINPEEEFEIYLNYWTSNCALHYLHKTGTISNLINQQIKSLIQFDSRIGLDIELSKSPSFYLENEDIFFKMPLNPKIYNGNKDLWLSLLADIQLSIEPLLLLDKNYTINITAALGNISFGYDFASEDLPSVYKDQIKKANWEEYVKKLRDFVKETFGSVIHQVVALPENVDILFKQIGLQNFKIKETESKLGFIIELDIGDF